MEKDCVLDLGYAELDKTCRRGTLEFVLAEGIDDVNHNPLEPINLYFRLII